METNKPRIGAQLLPREHQALDELVAVYDSFSAICGNGPCREEDMREVTQLIHTLQRMVLSQAAGRMYPTKYRLMGKRVELVEG